MRTRTQASLEDLSGFSPPESPLRASSLLSDLELLCLAFLVVSGVRWGSTLADARELGPLPSSCLIIISAPARGSHAGAFFTMQSSLRVLLLHFADVSSMLAAPDLQHCPCLFVRWINIERAPATPRAYSCVLLAKFGSSQVLSKFICLLKEPFTSAPETSYLPVLCMCVCVCVFHYMANIIWRI